jgi:hypothetical protein
MPLFGQIQQKCNAKCSSLWNMHDEQTTSRLSICILKKIVEWSSSTLMNSHVLFNSLVLNKW